MQFALHFHCIAQKNAVNMSFTCKAVWDVENLFLPRSEKDTHHSFLIADLSYPEFSGVKQTEQNWFVPL